ncbi:MAG: DUF1460 domain-containing protein [Alphaproteobacteria bacterium]|nr:DUF1460 domain-containing protein [Alphaproteobacteria bacterium]
MQRVLLPILLLLIGCTPRDSNNYIGTDLLGTQYINNPLGEGVAPDTDPLIRFDAFDCVTFVETVLADKDINKLNQIRYADGKPNFINRNHFIETDWLKNNADLIQNVSSQYAATKTRNILIDKKNWFKKIHNIDTDFAPQNVNLEYIPYEHARGIKTSKPIIVLFVIDSPKIRNKIGTDLAVRHMGLLLPNGVLRHASRRLGMVVDEDFEKYITQIMKNKNNLGIMLMEIKK